MHFVPWKTIDLDGAFRITAPDSISEEVIQEVSNGITFKFNGKLEKTKLEILLTAPFEWEETLHPTERENPPVKFICRLISRSTGRREIIDLEDKEQKKGAFGVVKKAVENFEDYGIELKKDIAKVMDDSDVDVNISGIPSNPIVQFLSLIHI